MYSMDTYGPALPPNLVAKNEIDTNDYVEIGPSLSEISTCQSSAADDIEKRSSLMLQKLTGSSVNDSQQKLQRESWMIELPPKLRQSIGLSARTFSKRTAPSTESNLWTDVPNSTEEKSSTKHKDSVVPERTHDTERDSHHKNKKQNPSLLEEHQKKLHKEKKKKSHKSEKRRPFDRETDLQVNRFDDAQRRKIIKNSQSINSKFSTGQFL